MTTIKSLDYAQGHKGFVSKGKSANLPKEDKFCFCVFCFGCSGIQLSFAYGCGGEGYILLLLSFLITEGWRLEIKGWKVRSIAAIWVAGSHTRFGDPSFSSSSNFLI